MLNLELSSDVNKSDYNVTKVITCELINSRVHWSANFFLWFRKIPWISLVFPPGKEARSFTCNSFFRQTVSLTLIHQKLNLLNPCNKKSLMWVTYGLSHEKPSCQTTGNLKGILPKRTKESERMKFEYIIFEKD